MPMTAAAAFTAWVSSQSWVERVGSPLGWLKEIPYLFPQADCLIWLPS